MREFLGRRFNVEREGRIVVTRVQVKRERELLWRER
jgi:hypothetical protein